MAEDDPLIPLEDIESNEASRHKAIRNKTRQVFRLPIIASKFRHYGTHLAPDLTPPPAAIELDEAPIEGFQSPSDLHHNPTNNFFVVDYSSHRIKCQSVYSLSDAKKPVWGNVRWIHVENTSEALLNKLVEVYDEYHISLKDFHLHSRRPKMEEYETHFSVVLHVVEATEEGFRKSNGDHPTLIPHSVSPPNLRSFLINVFVLQGCVITITEKPEPTVMNAILPALARPYSHLRANDAGYLLYALLKISINPLRKLIDYYETYLDTLEERITEDTALWDTRTTSYTVPNPRDLFRDIHSVKRELQQLRRRISGIHELIEDIRDIANVLEEDSEDNLMSSTQFMKRPESPSHTLHGSGSSTGGGSPLTRSEQEAKKKIKFLRFSKQTKIQLKHASNHCTEMDSSIQSLQEICNSLGDIIFQMLSQGLNITMKTLTVVSIIFVPLTFVAGVYGTNFDYLPEIKWRYGYLMMWIVFVLIIIMELIIFRMKHWI